MDRTAAPSLVGRWALVTGAGKRIGAAIARALHGEGINVVVHYFRSEREAAELVGELNTARPDSAMLIQGDVRRIEALEPMVEDIVQRTERLDFLINNASSFYPTPLATVTEAEWHDLIDSNLKAPLFLSRAALPYLRQTGGAIVNLIDVHWQRPLRDHPIYGAAKAGLAMLTRSLAKDLAPDVRVNGVSPGAILWPEAGLSEQVRQSILRQVPLRRAGDPADVAGAVLYLLSATYVTGHILAVDGGRSIGW